MAKYGAYGAILKKGATTIAAIRDIGGPSVSLDPLDVTTHDSTAAWREFIAGLKDGGEVSLDLVFDPANASQKTLRDDLNARTVNAYSITLTDVAPTVISFSALVTDFEPAMGVEDELSATATLKVTGAVTWA